MKVLFNDGETVRGLSFGHSKEKKGFFLIPVDPHSNNKGSWVVADAVRKIVTGPQAET